LATGVKKLKSSPTPAIPSVLKKKTGGQLELTKAQSGPSMLLKKSPTGRRGPHGRGVKEIART